MKKVRVSRKKITVCDRCQEETEAFNSATLPEGCPLDLCLDCMEEFLYDYMEKQPEYSALLERFIHEKT